MVLIIYALEYLSVYKIWTLKYQVVKRLVYSKPNCLYGIQIQHLYKKYFKTKNLQLDDININLKYNQKLGILGQNGAGKSTLINILSGFVNKS